LLPRIRAKIGLGERGLRGGAVAEPGERPRLGRGGERRRGAGRVAGEHAGLAGEPHRVGRVAVVVGEHRLLGAHEGAQAQVAGVVRGGAGGAVPGGGLAGVAEPHERVGGEQREHRGRVQQAALHGGGLAQREQATHPGQLQHEPAQHRHRRGVHVLAAEPQHLLVEAVQLVLGGVPGGEREVDVLPHAFHLGEEPPAG
jgi:hypothetical protein